MNEYYSSSENEWFLELEDENEIGSLINIDFLLKAR